MEKYITKTVPLTDDIAKEKNKLLKEMLASDCDYFFLVEDNCKVKDVKIYNIFIEAYKKTGIEAMMWGKGSVNKRIEFDQDQYIEYYTDFSPAFVMFTRNAVEKAGFFDEEMPKNTWQDLEYAKRIGDLGLSSPFGQFVSPKNIDEYLEITKEKDEFKNLKEMDEALKYWEAKSGDDFPIEIKEAEQKPKFEMI